MPEPSAASPASMDALRLKRDELADATVEALFARGDVGRFNTLMRWFAQSGQPLPDCLPDVAHDYLRATAAPPTGRWIPPQSRPCPTESLLD